MTVNQIFDTIQYGEQYTKNKALKESISKFYDEDLDLFYASKRIKELSGKIVMTEGEEQKINRLISKLAVIENRLEDGKTMSEAYRKMQTSALMDDCKALMEEATKSRKVDSRKLEIFGKTIATAKYFVDNSLDDKAYLGESKNPLFNKIISEEAKAIEEVL